MGKERVDLNLSFLPPCAAGRLLTVGMLGSCPSEMFHTEDFIVVFMPSSTAMGACSALVFSVGE